MADQIADDDLQHLLDMDDILTRTCSWDVQNQHTVPPPTTPDAHAAMRPDFCPDPATAPSPQPRQFDTTGGSTGHLHSWGSSPLGRRTSSSEHSQPSEAFADRGGFSSGEINPALTCSADLDPELFDQLCGFQDIDLATPAPIAKRRRSESLDRPLGGQSQLMSASTWHPDLLNKALDSGEFSNVALSSARPQQQLRSAVSLDSSHQVWQFDAADQLMPQPQPHTPALPPFTPGQMHHSDRPSRQRNWRGSPSMQGQRESWSEPAAPLHPGEFMNVASPLQHRRTRSFADGTPPRPPSHSASHACSQGGSPSHGAAPGVHQLQHQLQQQQQQQIGTQAQILELPQSQAAAVERLVVLDFKRTVAGLRPDVRDKLKESLYRISRSTNNKGGLMKTTTGPGTRIGGRQANMDGFVVQLLYNS